MIPPGRCELAAGGGVSCKRETPRHLIAKQHSTQRPMLPQQQHHFKSIHSAIFSILSCPLNGSSCRESQCVQYTYAATVRNAAAQQQPTSQAMTAKSPVDDTISAVNACVQCFAVVQASLGEKIRVAENGFSQEKYCHAFAPKFHVRVPAPTTHKSKMFCKKQQNEKEKEVFDYGCFE